MTLPCGHTEAEHARSADDLQRELAAGNISVLVPSLSNENLAAVLQSATIELIIRSQDNTAAEKLWNDHDGLVRSTFFVAREQDSAAPEWYRAVEDGRRVFTDQVNNQELRGASVPPRRREVDDRPMPGQYL
jgi:hypothetical protein